MKGGMAKEVLFSSFVIVVLCLVVGLPTVRADN
jgi:hypothetical protein